MIRTVIREAQAIWELREDSCHWGVWEGFLEERASELKLGSWAGVGGWQRQDQVQEKS